MGYTTDFHGQLELSRELTVKEKQILEDFNEERHGGNTEVFEGMPGFWCQWRPNEDGTAIEWDGGEKFYNYIEWLEYLIKQFFEPWGIKLNGDVRWYGEDRDDIGLIEVRDSVVKIKYANVTYEEE
jgi:hypothetical protein